jgi:hypothetical protein
MVKAERMGIGEGQQAEGDRTYGAYRTNRSYETERVEEDWEGIKYSVF